ncbi:ABC transporter permease [Gayadomonas joobiniege]|uniref:ABC transporter permease n=1 Tax=Gayadomonas joobiniege TaxID=1234606 RepID=UPI0003629BE6|nr:ABC transporter permease [Gayadomonas joobiniege]
MIVAIYKKELLELLREKKTLMFMVLLPLVIFPAIFGALAFFATKSIQDSNTRILNFYVDQAAYDNPLVLKLQASEHFNLKRDLITNDQAELKRALQDGQIDFWLSLGDSGQIAEDTQQQVHWKMYYYNADGLNAPLRRVNSILREIQQQITTARLQGLGLNDEQQAAILKPVVLEQNNLAPKRETMGSLLGGFIPYILLPLCLMGAIYPAIDLAAGEKERGTLESLIIAPVAASQLVLGKFLTVFTASMACVLVTLLSLLLWGFIFAQGFAVQAIVQLGETFGILSLFVSAVMLIPVALFVSALVLTIAVYAKNYKEAQNFMAPLSFLIFAPLIAAMLPGIQLNWGWAIVPISNVALSIKEILKGQADYLMLSTIWLSQLGLALCMLMFCIYWFKREAVLFR